MHETAAQGSAGDLNEPLEEKSYLRVSLPLNMHKTHARIKSRVSIQVLQSLYVL